MKIKCSIRNLFITLSGVFFFRKMWVIRFMHGATEFYYNPFL